MPRREAFDSPEFYYSVLFHELTHSTGSGSRLSRETLTQALHFGDTNYSREELVAEMGASFLSAYTKLPCPYCLEHRPGELNAQDSHRHRSQVLVQSGFPRTVLPTFVLVRPYSSTLVKHRGVDSHLPM
jgi:hypothetical protein